MSGLVTLLGAGPGDAELLTLKGKRRLQEADVLVFDRLVNQELFQHLKSDCEKIDVGKKPGQPCIRQEEIEKILIEKARQGKRVETASRAVIPISLAEAEKKESSWWKLAWTLKWCQASPLLWQV